MEREYLFIKINNSKGFGKKEKEYNGFRKTLFQQCTFSQKKPTDSDLGARFLLLSCRQSSPGFQSSNQSHSAATTHCSAKECPADLPAK